MNMCNLHQIIYVKVWRWNGFRRFEFNDDCLHCIVARMNRVLLQASVPTKSKYPKGFSVPLDIHNKMNTHYTGVDTKTILGYWFYDRHFCTESFGFCFFPLQNRNVCFLVNLVIPVEWFHHIHAIIINEIKIQPGNMSAVLIAHNHRTVDKGLIISRIHHHIP